MSLLQELQSLDLSAVVEARGSIKVAVESPDLQAMLSGGAAQTALAGLGGSMQSLRDSLDEPAALISPLVDAIAALGDTLNLDELPLGQYLKAVSDGATTVARLFEGLGADPNLAGQFFGFSFAETLNRTPEIIGNYTSVGLDDLARFRRLVEKVERGIPTDPSAIASLAIQVLLPFPVENLVRMRGGLQPLLGGVAGISLPSERMSGLVASLDVVATVAATGDAGELERALQQLERVRLNTIGAIRDDVLRIVAEIDHLRIGEVLGVVASAGATLRAAEEGVLEFLDDWREQIAAARAEVENMDASPITEHLPRLVAHIESTARIQIVEPIDAQVRQLEQWVRSLLRELGLRDLRARLSAFIHAIAQAIQDADLSRYARTVLEQLDALQARLDPAALTADIREALEAAQQVITDTLDAITGAISGITTAVEAVADSAAGMLNQAADALTSFKATVDEIAVAVDGLGIEQAAAQVVETLTQLRETAEALLTAAPLPESLRPLVQQLIDELQAFDPEVVLGPIREVVNEFQVPDTLIEGLQATQAAVQNLIPAELIRSINAEIDAALAVVRDFDPASLLGGVGGFLDEAADFVEGLDPRPLVEQIRAPYQAVLDAVDAAHPNLLLAPAIQAFDSVVGSIPVPTPEDAARKVSAAIGAAGEQVGRAAAEPLAGLGPPGSTELVSPDGPQPPVLPPVTDSVRPGDVIRLFGYLPNKLRETLAGLDAGPAGDALRAIDELTAGLARDLRSVQAALWDIESRIDAGLDELLVPLSAGQLRAQLSIQAGFSSNRERRDSAVQIVAQVGPGSMRAALGDSVGLARVRARQAVIEAGGQTGAALESAAVALERTRLAGMVGDLDGLLAALDPEPLAAELDALLSAVLTKAPELLVQIKPDLEAAVDSLQALIREMNPGTQAQKFLVVLDVVRDELEALNPRRLAVELGEVHAAIRATLAAYDPALFAEEIAETLTAVATALRALDPEALLGDTAILDDVIERVEAALPGDELANVAESLTAVGERLAAIDVRGLEASVEGLGPRLLDALDLAITSIQQEIIALLKSLQYASAHASAEVTVGGG